MGQSARSRAVGLVGLACALLLVWGYRLRDELYFTPDEQLGYVLGIVGLGCMVLLLGYSLRKRMRPLASLGPVRSWFQVHMVLGLLGPTAILFHCNFQVGAVNSGVALACVLLVARLGLDGFGARSALAGAGVLATLPFHLEIGRSARPDSLLALFVTAAIYF